MSQTIYIEVQANSVSTFSRSNLSDYDTTSGYYISYSPTTGDGGGYTGTGWYLTEENDPFDGYINTSTGQEVASESEIVNIYNNNGGNLNDVFSSWINRVGPVGVSNFCNYLMNTDAYSYGCITMVDSTP